MKHLTLELLEVKRTILTKSKEGAVFYIPKLFSFSLQGKSTSNSTLRIFFKRLIIINNIRIYKVNKIPASVVIKVD
ncbi:hypothetical protein V7306_24500 [Neobacillus vireti]